LVLAACVEDRPAICDPARGDDCSHELVVNDDGTVTDATTGLVWQSALEDINYDWNGANTYCAGLTLAGGGWRLPDRSELESLVDYTTTYPTINSDVFPDTRDAYFWTSSVEPGVTDAAWVVDFGCGNPSIQYRSTTSRVRCVL
jgi:hypothetical protein